MFQLKVWGGHCLNPGTYFFDTLELAETKLRELLSGTAHKNMANSCREVDGKFITVADLVFKYLGKEFSLSYSFGMGYPEEGAVWMFTTGNYGCSCNRSIFLNEKYPEFPVLDCGEGISVKSITICKVAPKEDKQFYPDSEIKEGVILEDTL